MEILTIVLSGLLGVLAPIGFIADSIVANNLRQRIEGAEVLAVRIDNEPSYQLIQGKVNKVRIATRNLELIPDLIINTLEIETDAIDLDINTLQQGENSFNRSLRKPLQGGVRLVITEADLNRALKSPRINAILQQGVNQAFNATNYKLLNPQINLLDNNRIAASATIDRGEESTPLDIMFELGINVMEGRKLELVDIEASIRGRRLPRRFLASFARGINERLDLRRLDERGITAVLLQLETKEEKLNIAGFFAIDGSKLDEEEQTSRIN